MNLLCQNTGWYLVILLQKIEQLAIDIIEVNGLLHGCFAKSVFFSANFIAM